ncbi:MAG: TOBE domain-containing protein, partial [Desulfatiglandales bacterium]
LAVRPSSVQLFAIVKEGEENVLTGVVISRIFQGDRTVYILKTDLGELTALRSETQTSFEEGESVFVKLKSEELVVLTERK